MNQFFNKALTFGKAKSPILAAVAATFGFAVTIYMVAKKSPKVPILLKNAEQKKGEPLTTGEKAGVYVRAYAVPGLTFFASAGLNIWSAATATNKIETVEKGLAATTALYSVSQARNAELERKAAEAIGSEGVHKIRKELNEEHAVQTPAQKDTLSSIPVSKKTYWVEENTGVVIRATLAEVEHNIQILNEMVSKDYEGVPMSDFLDLFGERVTPVYPKSAHDLIHYGDAGNIMLKKGLCDEMTSEMGEPVLWLGFNIDPVPIIDGGVS